jgi:hypothetical protein
MFKGDFVVTSPILLPGHPNYLKIPDAILNRIVAVEVTGLHFIMAAAGHGKNWPPIASRSKL